MDKNGKTLAPYKKSAAIYIAETPQNFTSAHRPIMQWIDASLALLPKHDSILEIGGAMPRDARYMRSKGFRVLCSDAIPEFVEHLREQGERAVQLNVLRDPIPGTYDMIYANAVMQHFTKKEVKKILKKILNSLKTGGLFALDVRSSQKSAWIYEKGIDKRFVQYWQFDDLQKLITKLGFKIIIKDLPTQGDLPGHIWIHVTIQKV